ncbi:hypothetical protein EST38_g1839 [Candolleomyces aberdarensis]|uniref:Nop52-domain-containing protein n=1 Tax=Candolleomyces aberdarensis TaxID=2316362 RepID=A0A4Q2DX61_9AGAR|nr:hypothetical protein EST38_g1839 [Candolleomyces aberdarensis]
MAATASSSTSLPLGKVLASTDKKTRDRAIKNLSEFLSENSENEISEPEMNKLWKGVFYCFWMSDKPLVQQALASELAELVLTITSSIASIAFLRGFWHTLVREWSGIDQLRLDKYYMLVRRFVNASFRLLARAKWDAGLCRDYNAILANPGGPLCPTDVKAPLGLSYHLADIYLDELNKVLESTPQGTPAPILLILDSLFSFSAQTTSKVAFKRLQTTVWEPLLRSLSSGDAEDEEEEEERPRKRTRLEKDDELSGLYRSSCLLEPSKGRSDKQALGKGVRRKLFEIASSPGTRDSNRKKLYTLWKEEASESDDE